MTVANARTSSCRHKALPRHAATSTPRVMHPSRRIGLLVLGDWRGAGGSRRNYTGETNTSWCYLVLGTKLSGRQSQRQERNSKKGSRTAVRSSQGCNVGDQRRGTQSS